MIILGVDTSCDETSAAVVDGVRVRSNVVSTQVRYHKKYGGVVPMLAGRLHAERIEAVLELALRRAGLDWAGLDALAVTQGPGLAPALQVGIAAVKERALRHGLPLYAVNHMAGHLASPFVQTGAQPAPQPVYPLLAALVSGGHSELVLASSFKEAAVVGQTLDDALGEAYDKVGKMLGLGYPGGRVVARLADDGDPERFALPVPMQRSGDLNLSYSGLKNAVRLLVEARRAASPDGVLAQGEVADICAGFEQAAQESLLAKVRRALSAYPEARQLVLAGGVAANRRLRREVRRLGAEFGLAVAMPRSAALCTDNAAMIAAAAWFGMQAGQRPVDPGTLDRLPDLGFPMAD